jgi:2-dehydro-3-deoxyphosphogluconate aldolase/(4S)-4-hydroxy-2-oxoglutarate aldolase
MFMKDVLDVTGICPILAYVDTDSAVPAAQALVDGGLPVLEVLMRDEHAMLNLKNIIRDVPEIVVGAGTILTIDQAKEAIDIGAKFLVLPGYNEKIVDLCCKRSVLVVPGCVTAAELMSAHEYGLEIIKFFPVIQMGGIPTIENLGGPFPMMRFIVTGNLDAENFLPFLKCPKILAAGGDWMFQEQDALKNRDFEQISRNLKNSVLRVQKMRGEK